MHKYFKLKNIILPIIYGLTVFIILLSIIAHITDPDEITFNKYYYYVRYNINEYEGRIYDRRSNNLDTFDRFNIYPEIIDKDYNDYFVVIKQKPILRKHKFFIYPSLMNEKFDLYINNLQNEGYSKQTAWELTYKFIDSVMAIDPYYKKVFSNKVNYYIIDLKDNIKYGPYNLKEYKKKRAELKVSSELKLEDE